MSDATLTHVRHCAQEQIRRLELDNGDITRQQLLNANKGLLRVIDELAAVVQQQKTVIDNLHASNDNLCELMEKTLKH